jgi:SAM-dependent methyltransferase
MGSDQRTADERPESWTTFTSRAYVAEGDDEAARAATTAWLEEQALDPFIREVAIRSHARLDLRPGESVLEMGCGTGVFLPALARAVGESGRVVGLDHAPAFLDASRTRLAGAGLEDRVELVHGDAHRLPFPDGSFDAAHCERVLMHLEDPDLAIRELVRVVRPGGRVVVAEVYADGAMIDHPDAELARRASLILVSGIRNTSMGLELRGRVISAGLVDVTGEVVGYFEEELDPDEGEEIARIVRQLGTSGEVEPARAEAFVQTLDGRRAAGTYCGLALIFVVSGRVPDR